MEIKEKVFKPRADILIQLGDQLIKNENIALLELVKNSYDANATLVNLEFYDIDKPLIGSINIQDDGDGMDIDTVTNVWMEPGNTHKKELLTQDKRPNRLPIGEKGIGRFGAYKIAQKIKLITRAKNQKEIIVNIDWSTFESQKYLQDVKVKIEERVPEIFVNNKTGTRIELTCLKKAWDPKDYKKVIDGIDSLMSPWHMIDNFKVDITKNMEGKKWDIVPYDYSLLKDSSLFQLRAEVNGNIITSFEYKFKPYDFLSKIKSRTEILNNIDIFNENEIKQYQYDNCDLGKIVIELDVFDKDTNIFNNLPNKEKINNCLKNFSGIRVYRDNLRVYDYGEQDNDWLNMDIDRVNNPSAKLSRNITIGAVFLNRLDSKDLIEKANREGFVENKAYEYFKNIVSRVINKFLTFRNVDKDIIREYYGTKKQTSDYIKEIQDIVEGSNIQEKDKQKVTSALKRIENDFKEIKMLYREIAGSTTSYGVAIHEIEKRILSLKDYVLLKDVDDFIKSEINSLSELIECYLDIIRRKKTSKIGVNDLIKRALTPLKYRFNAHKIDYDVELIEEDAIINVSEGLLIGCIMNIVDNSIYWVKNEINKKIILKSLKRNGCVYIIIGDNGPGFNIPFEDAIRPFVSGKIDGGMGMGLSLANDILQANNGSLILLDRREAEISEDYKGAILALCLREEIICKK